MISVRMSESSEQELKMIAEFEGLSVSEYVRKIINEKLEDSYDLKIGMRALEAHNSNPSVHTMGEVFEEL